MNSLDTCTSSHPRVTAGLLTVMVFGLSGCSLFSIDPDVIDVADDEVGESADESEEEDGTVTANDTDLGSEDGESSSTDDADDGPDGTSENASDTSDDTSDAEIDTGTETTTGDGMCDGFGDVSLGENDVEVADGASSFVGACGGSEAETLYSFMALTDGDHQFSLVGAEFLGVLYLLDESCAEIADSCSNSGETIIKAMVAGETVFVVVDSDGGVGSGTLVITGP